MARGPLPLSRRRGDRDAGAAGIPRRPVPGRARVRRPVDVVDPRAAARHLDPRAPAARGHVLRDARDEDLRAAWTVLEDAFLEWSERDRKSTRLNSRH